MDMAVILGNIVDFLLVSLIFICVLWITFKITLKNYNVKTSKLKFYGLFLGMDNKSVIVIAITSSPNIIYLLI